MDRKVFKFRVVEKGQWCYILWPWETPEAFLYEALLWDAMYELRAPLDRPTRERWIEFLPTEGSHGEYRHDLYFGMLTWGAFIYRRFNARSSHYLTQHGLDGISEGLQQAAYEYSPGEPIGPALFQFRVETRSGAFTMTHYDWLQYFVSGRNEHISKMGIQHVKKPK